MSRLDRWSRSRRPPAEIACLLARDRFWKDEQLPLIGTHPDWPDAALLLRLSEELAHAFVLVLSRLPTGTRRRFADAFYEAREDGVTEVPTDGRRRLALAAAVVLELTRVLDEEIGDERTLDLLRGAAQGDDLTRTPAPALEELRKTIARIRLEVQFDDPADPRGAAALALAEVLDPSSEAVDAKEVLARCAWAAVETADQPSVLRFLLEVDRLLGNG